MGFIYRDLKPESMLHVPLKEADNCISCTDTASPRHPTASIRAHHAFRL
jgi:hypothetical protein